MEKTLLTIVWCSFAAISAAVSYRAPALSIRYNAWTTSFRERNPHINAPPTPEARKKNTRIMTWLFRVLGAFFVVYSLLMLLGIRTGS
jgi:hypothetical protein